MKTTIENWSVVTRFADPYTAPESRTTVLQGVVFGHPLLPDGKGVTTSLVLSFDLVGRIAQTKNTTYHLGEPEPQYAEQFADMFTKAGWTKKQLTS